MARLFPHLPFRDDETPVSWAARLSALMATPASGPSSPIRGSGLRNCCMGHGW